MSMSTTDWFSWVDLASGMFGLKDGAATVAWFDAVREAWSRDGQMIHTLAELRAATIAVARGEKCWPEDMLRRLEAELSKLKPQAAPALRQGDPNESDWRCPAAIPTCCWGVLGVIPDVRDIQQTPRGPVWDTSSFDDATIYCRCVLGQTRYQSARGWQISKGENPDKVYDVDRYEFELARRYFEGDITSAQEWWPRQPAERDRQLLAKLLARRAGSQVTHDPKRAAVAINQALAKAGV